MRVGGTRCDMHTYMIHGLLYYRLQHTSLQTADPTDRNRSSAAPPQSQSPSRHGRAGVGCACRRSQVVSLSQRLQSVQGRHVQRHHACKRNAASQIKASFQRVSARASLAPSRDGPRTEIVCAAVIIHPAVLDHVPPLRHVLLTAR
jgi:hypothetical protein